MNISSTSKSLCNLILTFSLCLLITPIVKAENPEATTAPISGLSISPDLLVIKETNIGKMYDIKVTNNTTQKVQMISQEGIVIRNIAQQVVPVNEEVTKQFLEIFPLEFNIEPGSTFDLKVRTKFTSTDISEKFPAVIIKTKTGTTSEVGLNFEIYIPVLIQNLNGQYKLTTDLKINFDRFTFDPQISVSGVINNEGSKFFNPSGTLILSKDTVKLAEKEVTTQIGGLEFPKEARSFTTDFVIPDSSFKGVGEYIVESKIGSDLSGNVITARIKFIYIPKELIYLTGGALLGVIIITAIVKFVVKLKKPIYKK